MHGAVDLTQRLGAALERLRVERRRHRLLVILRALRHRHGGSDGGRTEREARAVRGHRVAKHLEREVCVRIPFNLRRERVTFRRLCTQSRLPGGARQAVARDGDGSISLAKETRRLACDLRCKLGPVSGLLSGYVEKSYEQTQSDRRRRIQKRVFPLFSEKGSLGPPLAHRAAPLSRARTGREPGSVHRSFARAFRAAPRRSLSGPGARPRISSGARAHSARSLNRQRIFAEASVERRVRVARLAGCRTTGRPGRRSGC